MTWAFAAAVGRLGKKHSKAEQDLLGACFGDREKSERLIAFEQARHSGLNRVDAAARAGERLRRDNR